jgi:hypothetical protein
MAGVPQANTDWNTTNRTATRSDAGDRVQQNGVDLAGSLFIAGLDHRLVGDAAGFALQRAEIVGRRPHCGFRRRQGFQLFVDLSDQLLAPGFARGARRERPARRERGEFRHVDLHTVALSKIDHVQRDDDRPSAFICRTV